MRRDFLTALQRPCTRTCSQVLLNGPQATKWRVLVCVCVCVLSMWHKFLFFAFFFLALPVLVLKTLDTGVTWPTWSPLALGFIFVRAKLCPVVNSLATFSPVPMTRPCVMPGILCVIAIKMHRLRHILISAEVICTVLLVKNDSC